MRFVWILPPLMVDPVRKDGIGVEVKIHGVVGISLEETCTKLRDEVRVLEVRVLKDSYRCLRLPIRQAWLYPLRLLVRYARPAQLSLEGLHRSLSKYLRPQAPARAAQ